MSSMDIPKIFGEILRLQRTEKGLSQEELAFRAGVDRTFVYRLEAGLRQPTITTLFHLGNALDISAADLLREAETQYRQREKEAGISGQK